MLLLLLSLLPLLHSHCHGSFNVYFLLDSSGSITRDDWKNETLFVRQMVEKLEQEKTKISIIVYSNEAVNELVNSGNKTEIEKALDYLEKEYQDTKAGIGNAVTLIQNSQRAGDYAIPVAILITDGLPNIPPTDGAPGGTTESLTQANLIRSLGGFVYSIGVGTSGITNGAAFLASVANKPSSQFVRQVSGESALIINNFADDLINDLCIQVDFITPDTVCMDQLSTIHVYGQGFNLANYPSCTFGSYKTNATIVSSTELTCNPPAFNHTSLFNFQVQINSFAYTQSNVTLNVLDNCTPHSMPGWAIALLVLFLLALLACCCWWYLPLMLGWKREKEDLALVQDNDFAPLADVASPPASGGPGKWAQVDTSKYIWAKDGGSARPMPVKWGNLGATKSATHLESETKIYCEESPYGNQRGNIQGDGEESLFVDCMDKLKHFCDVCFGFLFECFGELFEKCKSLRPHRSDFK